jgi:hypothetical protein
VCVYKQLLHATIETDVKIAILRHTLENRSID